LIHTVTSRPAGERSHDSCRGANVLGAGRLVKISGTGLFMQRRTGKYIPREIRKEREEIAREYGSKQSGGGEGNLFRS
jgi:hypothetical protein